MSIIPSLAACSESVTRRGLLDTARIPGGQCARISGKVGVRISGTRNVRTAVDGVSALWQIGQQRLDVVARDLDLPGVNSIAIHQELESREQTRHVPVVIVMGTACQSPVPAYTTLLKPISPDDLVNTVRQAALSQRLGA
jgi:CheY-like chemotaxis protein